MIIYLIIVFLLVSYTICTLNDGFFRYVSLETITRGTPEASRAETPSGQKILL